MSMIYEIKCACGNELTVDHCGLDGGFDLYIVVKKCDDCLDGAEETAEEEREELREEIAKLKAELAADE